MPGAGVRSPGRAAASPIVVRSEGLQSMVLTAVRRIADRPGVATLRGRAAPRPIAGPMAGGWDRGPAATLTPGEPRTTKSFTGLRALSRGGPRGCTRGVVVVARPGGGRAA